jgi:hemerythrin-like metal-binding protein
MTVNKNTQDLVIWSSEYSVQIPEIDEQHQTLVACINSLWRALTAGRDHEVICDLLETLRDYTETHFFAEETLMQEASYPDLEIHRQIHQSFVEKLRVVTAGHKKSQPVGMELLQFLTSWLINHIQASDRQFADFVRPRLQKGILANFEPLSRALNLMLSFGLKDDEPVLVGLDMRRAIETHMAWLARLRNYVDGNQALDYIDVYSVAKEDLCMLGNWLKINGSKSWAEDPGFLRLRNTHRTFHRTAAEAVIYRQSNDIEAANSIIKGELRSLSNEIRLEIVRLYSKIHG